MTARSQQQNKEQMRNAWGRRAICLQSMQDYRSRRRAQIVGEAENHVAFRKKCSIGMVLQGGKGVRGPSNLEGTLKVNQKTGP